MNGQPTGAASTGSTAPRASGPSVDWSGFMRSLTDLMQRQVQEVSRFAMSAADVARRAGQEDGGQARPAESTALVSSDALRAWGVLVQTMGSFWQQQGVELSRLFKEGVEGTLGADALARYGVRTWSQGLGAWVGAGQALSAAGTGSSGQIPSLVFYLDEDSEVAPAQRIPFRGPPETKILTTDVVRIGGPMSGSNAGAGAEEAPGILRAEGEKKVVDCQFCVERSELEVSLVGLSGQALEPGLYAGMVFSRQPGEARRVPQAFIWVFAGLKAPRSGIPKPRGTRPPPADAAGHSVH